MSEHTPGPWELRDGRVFGRDGTYVVGNMKPGAVGEADARRIVAAVNACEGIPTEALEGGIVPNLTCDICGREVGWLSCGVCVLCGNAERTKNGISSTKARSAD